MPSRSPLAEYQAQMTWSLATEKRRSPSELYLIWVRALSCSDSQQGDFILRSSQTDVCAYMALEQNWPHLGRISGMEHWLE